MARQRYTPAIVSAGDGKSFVLWAGGHGRYAEAGGVFVSEGKPVERVRYKDVDARGHGPGGPANPVAVATDGTRYLATRRTSAPISRGDTGGHSTWNGLSFVAVWHEFMTSGHGKTAHPFFAVKTVCVSPHGDLFGEPRAVAGTQQAPACYPAVAADGKGVSLIC